MNKFNTSLENYFSTICIIYDLSLDIHVRFLLNFQILSTMIISTLGCVLNLIFLAMIFKPNNGLTRNLKILFTSHVISSFGVFGDNLFLAVRCFMSRDQLCNLIIESYLCRAYISPIVLLIGFMSLILVCAAIERAYLARVYKNFDNGRYNLVTILVLVAWPLIVIWTQYQVRMFNF